VILSVKTHIVHTTSEFFFNFTALSTVFKEWYLKFQLNQANSFEVIALHSQASKKIDLYSNHIENKCDWICGNHSKSHIGNYKIINFKDLKAL